MGKQSMSLVKCPVIPVLARLRVTKEEDRLGSKDKGLGLIEDIFVQSKKISLKIVAFCSSLFQVVSFNFKPSFQERSSETNLKRCEISEGISPSNPPQSDKFKCVRFTSLPN